MENSKIYLHYYDEEYYGCQYEWNEVTSNAMLGGYDNTPSLETKDARLYTIAGVEYFIDELSEFIKPSVLLDFIKTLKDANTGEELYNHLQENVRYAIALVDSVCKRGDMDGSSKLNDCLFGYHEQYGSSDECHLAPFGDGKLLMKWLLPHDEFLAFFKETLKSRDKEMYAVAYSDKDMRGEVVKDIENRIRQLEKQKKDIDREIESEKARIKYWRD